MSPTTPAATQTPEAAARADEASAHTLLNCLVRELCGPAGQTSVAGGHLVLRLARLDVMLRVGLRRPSVTGTTHRFAGGVEELAGGRWVALSTDRLAELVGAELERLSGAPNPEFAGQVRASARAVRRALERAPRPAPTGPVSAYVASEQSLTYGHRFHPAPKARPLVGVRSVRDAREAKDPGGSADDAEASHWRAYAPEAGAAFRLHLLGVRTRFLREEHAGLGHAGFPPALEAAARSAGLPAGHVALPVHPWQFELLSRSAPMRQALRSGVLLDLGRAGPLVTPTASVRTLYDSAADLFYKTSLHVRITNCVRRSADYELRGAVALSRLLATATADLAARYPGTVLLAEPAYRALARGVPGGPPAELADALGVIVREGLRRHLLPGVTPLLAAAVADEYPGGPAHVSALVARLADRSGTDSARAALCWWVRYVELLVPPVLDAYVRHGVVLEPHLQNVVVGVGPDGLPRQVLHRDLEGVKLLHPPAGLPAELRAQVGYDARRGLDRLAYCLLVNNLGEMAAAVADLHAEGERTLWAVVRDTVAAAAAELGSPPALQPLLDGRTLPAKANLLARWARVADREAQYIPIPNPLAAMP
jgi:siderophore synthetase component